MRENPTATATVRKSGHSLGATYVRSVAPANAVAAWPAGNELEWTTYSG
jgi:hypothetical protein